MPSNATSSSRRFVYLVSFIAALAGLLFGFDTGIISGALLFIQKSYVLSTVTEEMIVGSVLIGAMLGSLSCGHFTDLYGRKRVIFFVALIFMVGTLIATLAQSPLQIIMGRILIGIAIGIGSYSAPLYIAEMVPNEIRGAMVSLNQLAITIGIMCSYFINYAFTTMQDSWRWMFAIGFIPAILLGIGMFFLPESPRWLMMKGKKDEAQTILKHLRREQDVQVEMREIEHSLKIKQATFKEIFAKWIRPVLIFGIVLGVLQQAVGINTIIYYAPIIFNQAGFHSASSSILATVGIGVINVLATVFAIYVIDKVGRRPLLLWGIFGMGISLACLSLSFYSHAQDAIMRWCAFAATFVYIISFAVSLGVMVWLLLSEMFPLEVRGAAMGLAVFSSWVANFAVSATFLSLLHALGDAKSFLMYALICAIAFVICYRYAPETKGVSLEQIEENIRKGLPVRNIGITTESGVKQADGI